MKSLFKVKSDFLCFQKYFVYSSLAIIKLLRHEKHSAVLIFFLFFVDMYFMTSLYINYPVKISVFTCESVAMYFGFMPTLKYLSS